MDKTWIKYRTTVMAIQTRALINAENTLRMVAVVSGAETAQEAAMVLTWNDAAAATVEIPRPPKGRVV